MEGDEVMFGNLLYDLFFFGIPIVFLLLFGESLYLFLSAKKKNKFAPGSVPESDLKKRKILLIVSSVLCGLFLAVVIGFVAIMFMAVAYM